MPENHRPNVENTERLAALEETALLDSPPEEAFDRLTVLAGKILRAPVILVSLIDKDRQFFKSTFGLPEPIENIRETPLSHSICKHVVGSREPLIVANAREHPLIQNNMAVSELGVMAYAGIPLTTSDGFTLGTFCAIDLEPRDWTSEEIDILRDLAAFTLTEIELRLAGRRLRDNLNRLQQLEALRDDLSHMLVHDLRTPLSSVLSGLQSLGFMGSLNDDQREFIAISVDGAKTLLRMVNDLLDISKIECGKLQLEYRPTSIADLVHVAIGQTDSLAKMNRLTVTRDVQVDLPEFIADSDKLTRVLVNLLGNAIKFTPKNGKVGIAVHYEAERDEMHFAVSDSGEGIPLDDIEAIFDKFAQVEGRRNGRQMSTGLGLTFCKLVVEAHGGRIGVESVPDQGSTFTFSIPCQAAPEATVV